MRTGSPLVKTMAARMLGRDYTPNFAMRLMAKDLAYSVAAGKSLSVNLATVATAHAALEQAIAAGYGDKDFSAVVEMLRKK